MKVNCFVVARHAEIRDGELVITRIGNLMMYPDSTQGPIEWPECFVVAHVEWSAADGMNRQLAIRLCDEDGDVVVEEGVISTTSGVPDPRGRPVPQTVVSLVHPAPLPAVGDYVLQLLANGTPVAEFALYASAGPWDSRWVGDDE